MSNLPHVVTATLTTERTTLRAYCPADEEKFVQLFQDAKVNEFVGDGTTGSDKETRELFQRIFTLVYAQGRFAVWAIEHEGRLAGHAEIKPSPADDVDGWEIVYILGRSHWGKGLGTEVAKAITDYGFASLKLQHVHATIDEKNEASKRIIAKIGYQLVQVRREEATSVWIYKATREAVAETQP